MLHKNKTLVITFTTILSIFCFPALAHNGGDDAKITQNITARIKKEDKGAEVVVSTQNGVVTLDGKAASISEASDLITIAQSEPGVTDVKSELKFKETPSQPFTDTMITAKVKGAFLREKLFGDKPISSMTVSVETKDGVVYLGGTAENAAQIATAEKIAKLVKGVKEVKTEVKAKNP